MKKHFITASILFLCITFLAVISNYFLRYENTAFEQNIFFILFRIGFFLEFPFLKIITPLAQDDSTYRYFEQIRTFIPIIAGAFYSILYYYSIYFVKLISNKRQQNPVA
jgi:hypothetical protein